MRPSTIYLIISFILQSFLFFLPFCQIQLTNESISVSLLMISSNGLNINANYLPLLVFLANLFFTAKTILINNKIKKQLLYSRLNLILSELNVIGIIAYVYWLEKQIESSFETHYQWVFISPLLAVLLAFLAAKSIKRDKDFIAASNSMR